ncbi:MAG: tetratricopeptide repeat protein [Planctomycetota bacterium]
MPIKSSESRTRVFSLADDWLASPAFSLGLTLSSNDRVKDLRRSATVLAKLVRFFCFVGLGLRVSGISHADTATESEPVVARVEMRLADGEKLIDVIEKGDLLTVIEVRDEEYVITTHDGSRGVVDHVNAVKLAEATDIYTELIAENPDEGRYHTLRASAWWALGKPEQALEDFNEAIEKGYEEAHAFSSRGLFYAAAGNPQKAIEDYNEALKRDSEDISPLINRAAAHMSLGKYDSAVDDYSEALRTREDNIPLLRQRALANKAAGRFDSAIGDFNAILEQDKDDVPSIMGRGYVYFQKMDFENAAESFSRAIELNDGDPVAFNNRGYNLYQIGEVEQALKDYDRAIELAPKYGLAYQNRAWLLATTEMIDLRDADSAVESAKQACEISNYKNISDLSALAASLAAQGKFDEAVGWQEKVVELAPAPFKAFAEKMKVRYEDERPYAADPDQATASEDRAAEAAIQKEAGVPRP